MGQDLKTDVTGYDLPTLVEWYISLRNYKSEIKHSVDEQIEFADRQMNVLEAEFRKRIAVSGGTAVKTEHGTISQDLKSKYMVADKYAFRQWIEKNPTIASQIISATVTQSELNAYIADGGTLPDGITVEQSYNISVRKK